MTLQEYLHQCILPRYAQFDAAHRLDHVESVMRRSAEMAKHYPEANSTLVMTAAAYHDLGLCEGRERHHLVSGRIVREDKQLRQWFTPDEIETIAQAAEDHRASSDHQPRSIYGLIVAEADRLIDVDTVVRRCLQYGLAHYPELTREQHYSRAHDHLIQKYGENGYLKLYLPESPNAFPLQELRCLIKDQEKLRRKFDEVWKSIQ